MQTYCWLDTENHTAIEFEHILLQAHAFQTVVCKMAAMYFRLQYDAEVVTWPVLFLIKQIANYQFELSLSSFYIIWQNIAT